jgi:hypothetical protein
MERVHDSEAPEDQPGNRTAAMEETTPAANPASSEMTVTNRAIRAGAACLSLVCMALSLTLLLRLGFLGFAIGGWTGLKGYEQAIADARHTAHITELRLAILQVLGGAFAFITLRRKLGVLWSPLFIVAFCGATFAILLLYAEIVTALH